jgi:hypothetical protein
VTFAAALTAVLFAADPPVAEMHNGQIDAKIYLPVRALDPDR